jgi:hypothetical protein
MSDLEIGEPNHELAGTELVGDSDEGDNFGNDFILRVVPSDGLIFLDNQLTGCELLRAE